jgi:hypothetical protein
MRPSPGQAAGLAPQPRAALHHLADCGAEALGLKNRGGGRAGPGKEDRDTAPAAPARFGSERY